MIKKLLREIYMLPRGEQRALIVLSFLLILSLLFRIGVQFLPGREPAGLEEFEKEARALMFAFARADSLDQARRDSVRGEGSRTYSISENNPSPSTSFYSPININRADSAQLLPLPGIGPVFAGRIIKYRDLLGGFVSLEQLGEVYGLSQETLEKIGDRIEIDISSVRKLPLDSASFRDLLRHPYLDLEQVKALVEYRDFKTNIGSLQELKENQVLADSTLDRMWLYFEVGR